MNKLEILNQLVEETEPLIGSESEEIKTTEYARFTKKYAIAFESDATLFRDLRMLFVNLKAHNIKLDFNAMLQLPADFIESKQFEMITFPTVSPEEIERALKNTKFRMTPVEVEDEDTKKGDEEEEEEEEEAKAGASADEEDEEETEGDKE